MIDQGPMIEQSRSGERTALAWRRTALAATATAAFFMTHALVTGRVDTAIASLVATVALMTIVWCSIVRNRSLSRRQWARGNTVVLLTAVTVLTVAVLATGVDLMPGVL